MVLRVRSMAMFAMLSLSAVLPLLAAAEPPAADDAETVVDDETSLPLLVFVGEKISIEPLPDPCEPTYDEPPELGETICISFDSLWLARYRIVERIAGESRHDEVAFLVADHYGFPGFGNARHALLYVTMASDGPYLQKYQGFAVARIGEGGWAVCGEDDDEAMPRAEPLQFLEAIDTIPDDVPTAEADGYTRMYVGPPPDFFVEGREVHCRRGVRVAALHRGLMEGVMRARGFPMEAGGLPPTVDDAAPPAPGS